MALKNERKDSIYLGMGRCRGLPSFLARCAAFFSFDVMAGFFLSSLLF